MRNNLQLYLDLNEIENAQPYNDAAEIIEKNSEVKIVSYNYRSFIMENYKNLIKGKMDLEDFMSAGDIFGKQDIYKNNDKTESLFEIQTIADENIKNIQDIIFVVTETAVNYFKGFSEEKYSHLLKLLEENKSHIIVL